MLLFSSSYQDFIWFELLFQLLGPKSDSNVMSF